MIGTLRRRWNSLLGKPAAAPPAIPGAAVAGEPDALRKAIAEERRRLLADLHDDVGAKLVTLIHSLENPDHADLARAVLQDLRDVVSRSDLGPLTLLEALAQIREEAEKRLACMHCTLEWQQAPLPDPALDESQALHLFRISREAITNALWHGHATQLRVRVLLSGNILLFDVTDNGPGLAELLHAGRGTVSMKQRAEALHGNIDWAPGTHGGTKVVLQFPLPIV